MDKPSLWFKRLESWMKRTDLTREQKMDWLREQALQKADQLTRGKGKDYGHFSTYPIVVLASLNFVKAKRMMELATKMSANPDHRAQFEPMADSCLDAINYASFMWAKIMEKEHLK